MFNIDQILNTLKTDQNAQRTAMTGAAGLAAGLLLGRGGFGKLAKIGAVAAVGGLAYNAWKNHQAQQGGGAPVAEDRFIPPAQAGYQTEELSKSLVRAMIAATKADGKIDADEKEAIFKRLETMPLGAAEKAFVFDELSSPLDINAVVARADTAEHAAEIYAASLVAITADTAAERAYLDALAHKLQLAPGLVEEIHKAAGAHAPSPGHRPGRGIRADRQRLSYTAVLSCGGPPGPPSRVGYKRELTYGIRPLLLCGEYP